MGFPRPVRDSNDGHNDLGRIRRQQTMLRVLAGNALGRNLANPLRANALVGSVVHSLTKDDRLTLSPDREITP